MSFFGKYFENLREKINGQGKKKLIENCVIIIILGVVAIIAGSTIFSKTGNEKTANAAKQNEVQEAAKVIGSEDKEDIQKRMESILSKIGGAGSVNVMITYVSGKELVPAYDTKRTENDTQEKDNGGGTRSIKNNDTENKVVYEESGNGVKKPVVLKELQPAVKGVVVVADGAADPVVRESLTRAVQVLVDVPVHKIQVLQRNK